MTFDPKPVLLTGRVEIGGTWLAPAAQRTLANTEAKYLQLVQWFEVLGAVRVQFRTDLRNTQSQRALEKLGAIREGVNHSPTRKATAGTRRQRIGPTTHR